MSPDVVLSGQRGPRWLFVPAVPSAGQGFGSGIPLGRSSSLLGARVLASVGWATCLPCWDAPAPPRPQAQEEHTRPGSSALASPTPVVLPRGKRAVGCGAGSGGGSRPCVLSDACVPQAGRGGAAPEPGAGRPALGPRPWARFCRPSPLAGAPTQQGRRLHSPREGAALATRPALRGRQPRPAHAAALGLRKRGAAVSGRRVASGA